MKRLTVIFVMCLVLCQATAAQAAWSGTATKTSGTYGMATIGYAFTPLYTGLLSGAASGTGGSTYTSVNQSGITGLISTFELTNNSSVSTTPTITITPNFSASISLFPGVSLTSCSVAWTSSTTCSGTQTTIGSFTASAPGALVLPSMNSGSVAHLQINMSAVSLGTISVSAAISSSSVRAGMDRTTG